MKEISTDSTQIKEHKTGQEMKIEPVKFAKTSFFFSKIVRYHAQ